MKLGLLSVNIPFPLAGSDAERAADGKGAAATSAEKDSATRFVEEIVGIGASHVTMPEQEIDPFRPDLEFFPNVPAPLRSDSGDVQDPRAPPRDRPRFPDFHLSVRGKNHQQVEAAVEEVLRGRGCESTAAKTALRIVVPQDVRTIGRRREKAGCRGRAPARPTRKRR